MKILNDPCPRRKRWKLRRKPRGLHVYYVSCRILAVWIFAIQLGQTTKLRLTPVPYLLLPNGARLPVRIHISPTTMAIIQAEAGPSTPRSRFFCRCISSEEGSQELKHQDRLTHYSLVSPRQMSLSESTYTHVTAAHSPAVRNGLLTRSGDWPSLRACIIEALDAVLPAFVALGPPRPAPSVTTTSSSELIPPTQPSQTEISSDDAPPPESLLLSPSRPEATLAESTSSDQVEDDFLPKDEEGPPSSARSGLSEAIPTRGGGLIIPPFPPLDPARRRASTPGRPNGIHSGPGRPNIFEDDWGEEVVIGGKKLTGWYEEEEGKKELARVAAMLDDLDL